MNINIVNFNISIGKQKPRTNQGLPNQTSCPFCDVEHLTNIIDQQDDIILLKNKYNVMEPSDQLVIIETSQCQSDIPDYSQEHIRRLTNFSIGHWLRLLNSGKYSVVAFFKNFGPLSGGTLSHPHMQIIGFPELNPELLYDPGEFAGITVFSQQGIEVNISTQPRVGFTEINIIATENAYAPDIDWQQALEPQHTPMPLHSSLDTLADALQDSVAFLKETFRRHNFSYNLFFYIYQGRIHLRIMPRFPTSPLYIGYNIHLNPTNRDEMAQNLQAHLSNLIKD